MAELVCNELRIGLSIRMIVACVRRITWKFAQPRPTVASFGSTFRRQTLSLLRGVMFSEGNTHERPAVFIFQACNSARRLLAIAAARSE